MGVFNKPKKQKVVLPDDESVEEARRRQQRAALLAQGRRSTIATGPGGVGGSTQPNITAPSTVL